MTNRTYKRLLKLTLVLLIASCTTGPVIRQERPPQTSTPTRPPVSKQMPEVGNYSAATVTGEYAESADLQNFIQYMVQQHGFSQSYLNGLFSQATYLASVDKLENPVISSFAPSKPGSGSWSRYRKQFLDEAHINNAVNFWRENAGALQRASETYGVDPEYIVAIIGVETYFGRNVGKTRIIDALTTLAFDSARRAKFFTTELEHFLLMTREESYEPRSVFGSWAGAMGLGQFMPSSFRKLAVDFNQDGKRDLWLPEDAIGSVANYFSKSGWQFHAPVATPVEQADAFSTIELSTYSGSEFWSVYPNFNVIKKYNKSDKYAMAVHQLAQACKERYQYQ